MDSWKTKELPLDALMPLIKEQLAAGKCVRFSPRGVSMLPMLRQGKDSVTLSPLPNRLKKYDLPLYQRDDGKYILHRIICTGETYTCMGDNQFDPEVNVRRDQMIALVTAFTRGEKTYKANSLSYRIYCRFWHYTRFPRHVWRWLKWKFRGLQK